jgi:hypothetical protein
MRVNACPFGMFGFEEPTEQKSVNRPAGVNVDRLGTATLCAPRHTLQQVHDLCLVQLAVQLVLPPKSANNLKCKSHLALTDLLVGDLLTDLGNEGLHDKSLSICGLSHAGISLKLFQNSSVNQRLYWILDSRLMYWHVGCQQSRCLGGVH